MGHSLHPIHIFQFITSQLIVYGLAYLLFIGEVVVQASVDVEDLPSLLVVIAKGKVLRLQRG